MTILNNLPFSDYLARPEWGSSSLAAMRRGPPARVKWEREHPREDTDATLLGTLVHCALLTPNLLGVQFVCKPEGMNFSTKDGKAWRDAQTAQIVAHDAYTTAQDIVAALHAKAPVGEVLAKSSHREVALIWECSGSGEACKGRPDWISGRYLYDLKVSRHADGSALGYRAYVQGWMHQAAHYLVGAQTLGLDLRGARLVVVAPKPPHFVHALEVKTDALDLLALENVATLQAMRECRLANDWPGVPDTWTKIEPPAAADVAFGEMSIGATEEEMEEKGVFNG